MAARAPVALFARAASSWHPSTLALLPGSYTGVDVSIDQLGAVPAARRDACLAIQDAGRELLLRLSTAGNGSSAAERDDSPDAHLTRFEKQLDEALTIRSPISHLLVDAGSHRWSAAEWLEYLHGALRLSALALESAPEIGATTRELDKFGGRPVHLVGVSHTAFGSNAHGATLHDGCRADSGSGGNSGSGGCRGSCDAHSHSSNDDMRRGLHASLFSHVLDVYPILRLSVDLSDWPGAESFESAEPLQEALTHTDHVVLSMAASGAVDGAGVQRGFVSALCETKASRHARATLCSLRLGTNMSCPEEIVELSQVAAKSFDALLSEHDG